MDVGHCTGHIEAVCSDVVLIGFHWLGAEVRGLLIGRAPWSSFGEADVVVCGSSLS